MSPRQVEETHERVKAILDAMSLPLELQAHEVGMMIRQEEENLVARLDYLTPERVFLWFQIRTTSWDFQGERTDLHDVISLALASLLSVTGNASCRLIDQVNPAVIPGLDDEIYARVLVPAQPGPVLQLDRPEPMQKLLQAAWSLEFKTWLHLHDPEDCPCQDEGKRVAVPVDPAWEEGVLKALRHKKPSRSFASGRVWPEWEYLRSPRSGVTVVSAPRLASMLAVADANESRQVQQMEEGRFVRAGEISSLVPPAASRRARTVLRQLSDLDEGEEPHFFPLEDRLVASGRFHLLALPADCGQDAFRAGWEQAQHRVRKELAFFGAEQEFEWAEQIAPDRFEELVGELLERAGHVAWIRQVGATSERDRGRDFVAEWVTVTEAEELPEETSPQLRVPVIVQCKAAARPVNATDVPAIVDTVEEHQAQGYFLAVADRLSAPLVDRLMALRQRERFQVVDWWGRREIEQQLRHAADVLPRYHDVVRFAEASPPS